jgi:ubiquinone/menaquinone biosynthesis C-methylase UbiE
MNKLLIFPIVLLTALLFEATNLSAQTVDFKIEDWEKRINERQPPELVLEKAGFKKGMTVGEIGAGTGRMTLWIADKIGPEGIIYANDIDVQGLEHLRNRADEAGFKNIRTIVGGVTEPKLPEGKMDIVFMINVFHHLDDPVALLKNTRSAFKPGGYLVIVDCDPDKVAWGKGHGCTGKEEMHAKLTLAGYKLIEVIDILREDGIYIAEPVR